MDLRFELLEAIGRLEDELARKDELIVKLVNENLEKENMISELMKGFLE